uniref:Uncharacterized protein n=1 Tax=Anguilla anguilla TaxID=7936 RepID=A0A0E9SBD3_ANGAN
MLKEFLPGSPECYHRVFVCSAAFGVYLATSQTGFR